jgi:hypothetical protein
MHDVAAVNPVLWCARTASWAVQAWSLWSAAVHRSLQGLHCMEQGPVAARARVCVCLMGVVRTVQHKFCMGTQCSPK